MLGLSRVNPQPAVSLENLVYSVKSLSNPNSPFHPETNAKWSTSLRLIRNPFHHSPLASVALTNGPSDHSPQFLDAHASTVVFLSSRSGSQQLWAVSLHGGEPYPLTSFPVSVDSFKVAPQHGGLVFSARVLPANDGNASSTSSSTNQSAPAQQSEDVDSVFQRTAKHLAETPTYLSYDRLYIRRWDAMNDGCFSHLFFLRLGSDPHDSSRFIVEGDSKKTFDLMPGIHANCPMPSFGGAEHYDIHPSKLQVAFTALHDTTSAIAWSTNSNIHLVDFDLSGSCSTPQVISSSLGYDTCPLYSPNGNDIYYLSMKTPQYEADHQDIMVYHAETQNNALFCELDLSPSALAITPDGQSLIVPAETQGHQSLFKIDIPTQHISRLVSQGTCHAPAIAGTHLVYGRDDFCNPVELFSLDLADAASPTPQRALTAANRAALQPLRMASYQDLRFPGANGDAVQGWFFAPASAADWDAFAQLPPASVPLCLIIHGGPQGAIADHFHFRWNPQVLAAEGYAVLCINFHGSTGFGQTFVDSIRGEWGGLPFLDILAGLDFALARFPALDPKRVAALGASYGGYMVNWLNGNAGERFRCLVCHDGIFNIPAFYYTTEELFFLEDQFKGPQYLQPALYERWSPHRFVAQWNTPCLVIHGGKDYRVPDTEGIAAFTALQRKGIASKYLWFPEENHWVVNVANSLKWHQSVFDWLHQFLH